jgi:hypothetical protein
MKNVTVGDVQDQMEGREWGWGVDRLSGWNRSRDLTCSSFVQRRIAAISLAKRVADEMGEVLGRTVGYMIGAVTAPVLSVLSVCLCGCVFGVLNAVLCTHGALFWS